MIPIILIAAIVFVANIFPLIFVITTVALCTFLFAKHQHDLLLKERSIYTDRKLTSEMNGLLVGQAYFEAVIFGCIAGLLPVILLNGSYSGRTVPSTIIFVVSILIFYGILRGLREWLQIRPLQWGLLRLSLPAGIVYSILDSIFVRPRPLNEIFKEFSDWKDIVIDIFSGGNIEEIIARRAEKMDANDLMELFHTFIAFADEVIYRVLVNILGDIPAFVLHIFLTLNLTYGIPICAFSVLLLIVGGHHLEPKTEQADAGKPDHSTS